MNVKNSAQVDPTTATTEAVGSKVLADRAKSTAISALPVSGLAKGILGSSLGAVGTGLGLQGAEDRWNKGQKRQALVQGAGAIAGGLATPMMASGLFTPLGAVLKGADLGASAALANSDAKLQNREALQQRRNFLKSQPAPGGIPNIVPPSSVQPGQPVASVQKQGSLALARNTGISDVDGEIYVNDSDTELLGKLGFDLRESEYEVLEKTSEVLDLYSYIEKIAGVPKEVAKLIDSGQVFSGEYLKDMGYNVPKGYEVKGDLCCPSEKAEKKEKRPVEKTERSFQQTEKEEKESSKKTAAANPAQTILVTGHSGAGKSTLAKTLAEKLNIPLHRVDAQESWDNLRADLERRPDYERLALTPGTSENQKYIKDIRKIVGKSLKEMEGPSVLEGTQVTTLGPRQLRKYMANVLVGGDVEQSIAQRLQRMTDKAAKKGITLSPEDLDRKMLESRMVADSWNSGMEKFKKVPGVINYNHSEHQIDPLVEQLKQLMGIAKKAEYKWHKSKDLHRDVTNGRHYPFSFLTGGEKAAVDPTQTVNKERLIHMYAANDPDMRILSQGPVTEKDFLYHASGKKFDILDPKYNSKKSYGYEYTEPVVFAGDAASSAFAANPTEEYQSVKDKIKESVYHRLIDELTGRKALLGHTPGGYLYKLPASEFTRIEREDNELGKWNKSTEYISHRPVKPVSVTPIQSTDVDAIPEYEYLGKDFVGEMPAQHYLKQAKNPKVIAAVNAWLANNQEKADKEKTASESKPGLWANIHAKRKRGEKAAKPGDEDYPDKKQWNKLSKEGAPRYQKEILKMSPDKAREAIKRMALGIPEKTVPSKLVSSPSKSLLTAQLADDTDMDIPSTLLRLKETMRDMKAFKERAVPTGGIQELTPRQRAARFKDLKAERKGHYAPTQAETHGIDPEAELPFIHGGGENFLKSFLEGKNKGYRLENDPRKGIQVHGQNPGVAGPLESPEILKRTNLYANSGAAGNFDTPAKLTGRVKAKHLLNANNDYEHAITDPSHIIDPVLGKLPVDRNAIAYDKSLLNTLTPLAKQAAANPAQTILITGHSGSGKTTLSKFHNREKIWKDIFKEKGSTYHPKHMEGGSNFAKPSKIIKALASAGIRISQKEAEKLANKYTGGKMEKESELDKTAKQTIWTPPTGFNPFKRKPAGFVRPVSNFENSELYKILERQLRMEPLVSPVSATGNQTGALAKIKTLLGLSKTAADSNKLRRLILAASKGCQSSKQALSTMGSKKGPRKPKILHKPSTTDSYKERHQGIFPFLGSHEAEIAKNTIDPAYVIDPSKYLGKLTVR
jgi:dephospho-CoA kinase